MKTSCFVTLLLFFALRQVAAAEELVFYDSMEIGESGGMVTRGGVYREFDAATGGTAIREAHLPAADGFYHMRFVVDPGSLGRAKDFVAMFLSHPAFSPFWARFSIEYLVAAPEQLNCRNDVPGSPRIIRCDTDYALSLGTAPVHLTAIFTSRASGGAGGRVPIASLDYPLPTMLHEMLHVWGLNDEYTYSASEAAYYCNTPRILKGPNTASFSQPGTYTSDTAARAALQDYVPWLDAIVSLPVTGPAGQSGQLPLGTLPAVDDGSPGLFTGANCSLVRPSFRAYRADTIMKSLSSTWLPPVHRKAVLAVIGRAAGWN